MYYSLIFNTALSIYRSQFKKILWFILSRLERFIKFFEQCRSLSTSPNWCQRWLATLEKSTSWHSGETCSQRLLKRRNIVPYDKEVKCLLRKKDLHRKKARHNLCCLNLPRYFYSVFQHSDSKIDERTAINHALSKLMNGNCRTLYQSRRYVRVTK